ncbi:hypothetical protein PVAP13_2NG313500 [Panicum virgatum]|uniref:Uncharacterized protein n=1 Tax=Panicum virgatum TaxID=38727 RepID=A0A8T0VRE0_PANVG|nr:hypothetical protein PVAP13_2NG313500 [Panicum virgatum]
MLQFRTVPKLNSLYLLVVVEWSKIKQTEKIVFGSLCGTCLEGTNVNFHG